MKRVADQDKELAVLLTQVAKHTFQPREGRILTTGGVSMGEARALDRAAEVIEDRAVEVPEPDATAPDNTEGTPLEVESTAPPIADETAD